jgi:hypothetical protein
LVLGVLIVIALVSAVGAVHQFGALVGNNTKDELSRYLDDHAHTTISPGGGGFRVDFPVPPTRQLEQVSTGVGTLTVPRDGSLVDDEVTFEAVWFEVPGAGPALTDRFLGALVALQVHQFSGSRIADSRPHKVGRAMSREFVFASIDRIGVKRYFDEWIIVEGRRVWLLRVGSRIRRDEAFRAFVSSFAFTS